MFFKTLQKRAENTGRGTKGGQSLGMIVLFNPNPSDQPTVQVITCPEDRSLEGEVFLAEASRSNIRTATTYANQNQREVMTAIDRMYAAVNMARAKNRENAPQMLFYLPSAYRSGNKILINISPFSCRTPEFEGNTNIRYPVYGFAGVECFISNIMLNISSPKIQGYDMVNYFICKKNPVIHEGFLNDMALGEALEAEALKNPLLDEFTGGFIPKTNADLYNENAQEAIKYQICLKGHPEIVLFGNVSILYDFATKQSFRTGPEILDRLINDIRLAIASRQEIGDEELNAFLRENVYVRAVSGFRLHDALFDFSARNSANTNRRLLIPLHERCVLLQPDDPENKDKENTSYSCMPPLKRVPDEERRHLYTIRSLAIQNPDGRSCSYPKGDGVVVIKSRQKKDSDDFYYYLSLEAGFLTHRARDLTTRYSMKGTEYDLSDNGIPRDRIFPLLKKDPEEAAAECRSLYTSMMNGEIEVVAEPAPPVNEVPYPDIDEDPDEGSNGGDEVPF